MTTSKICSKCKAPKPITEFEKDKREPLGYGTRCRTCVRQYYSKWVDKNREHVNAYSLDYYYAHKEKHLERTNRWYASHKDQVRAAARRRYQADPEPARQKRRMLYWKYHPKELDKAKAFRKKVPLKRRSYEATRRARKTKSDGQYTDADVLAMLEKQNYKCRYCGADISNKYEVDHVIPLSRGGSNDPSNIVIACQPCNGSKHNKLISEWRPELLAVPAAE